MIIDPLNVPMLTRDVISSPLLSNPINADATIAPHPATCIAIPIKLTAIPLTSLSFDGFEIPEFRIASECESIISHIFGNVNPFSKNIFIFLA